MEYIVLRQNPEDDSLDIGIKCFVICGDADGDGNPDQTSAALAGLGGVDNPNWALSESALIAFDFDNNGGLDFIIGYPAAQSSQSSPFPCGTELFDSSCFGLYRYQSPFSYSQAQFRFRWVNNDAALGASPTTHARDNNPETSAQRPHIEWTILGLNGLLGAAGLPQVDYTGVAPWNLNMLAFIGSFEDDGIGEDFMPGANQIIPIEWPCRTFDDCGVCGGDGSTCADCAGVPNGNAQYDVCDVCAGNGQSCLDCNGVPNGPAQYDICNVCNGDGTSCLDCADVPFGTRTYDVCDVCGGNGQSCLDCAGVPNGPNQYDVCDVCAGDGTTCLDCAFIPNGPNVYDVCDVCGGDGQSCLDCAGVPNGPAVYDECGVCEGDGKSCRCDGALLVQSCDHPMTLVRNTCVTYQGQTLNQEVWLDNFDGAREVHYFVALTNAYYGDESAVNVNQLSACDCGCQ